MTDFLERVVAERRADAAASRLAATSRTVAAAAPPRPLDAALRAPRARRLRFAVIAEVKRRSPALGALGEEVDAAAVARAYADAGAAAISVITEPRHWGGSLADLVAVREAVSIPVLCKDVIVDGRQLDDARSAGADAVLLIAEALDDLSLARLVEQAHELGLGTIVEAHEATAFGRAVRSRAGIVGVNARDLREPGQIDRTRIGLLAPLALPGQVLVAESGIETLQDARGLPARVDAILVGSALMRSLDPGTLLASLASIEDDTTVTA